LSIDKSDAENWTKVTFTTACNNTWGDVVVNESANSTGSLGETCLDDEGT
jgi:hypothetical protein